MASDSPSSSTNEDTSTQSAFYFLLGALSLALLAGLWALLQVLF
jgi:hypothetical protein